MKKAWSLIVFLFLAQHYFSQTTVTIGGSVGKQGSRNGAIGLGGYTRVSWPAKTQVYRFIEGGFENFQYHSNMYLRNYSWNYLRLNWGRRKFTVQESSGIYVDIGAGFYGVLTSGNTSKQSNFYPGAGAFFGLGFAKNLIMLGLQLHASYSNYGAAIVPLFNIGINFNQ